MFAFAYGLLAVLGLILPWYYNLEFMTQNDGFHLLSFLQGCFANPAASSISVDLLIGASAFIIWMVSEGRRLGMQRLWLYLLLTFTVAFAFAAPLFLLMRARHLAAVRGHKK